MIQRNYIDHSYKPGKETPSMSTASPVFTSLKYPYPPQLLHSLTERVKQEKEKRKRKAKKKIKRNLKEGKK